MGGASWHRSPLSAQARTWNRRAREQREGASQVRVHQRLRVPGDSGAGGSVQGCGRHGRRGGACGVPARMPFSVPSPPQAHGLRGSGGVTVPQALDRKHAPWPAMGALHPPGHCQISVGGLGWPDQNGVREDRAARKTFSVSCPACVGKLKAPQQLVWSRPGSHMLEPAPGRAAGPMERN